MKRKEILTENPLAIALMGALVGMGLEKEKAKKAAAQAVNQAQSGKAAPAAATAPQGADYNQIMKRGSRGEGVKQLQINLGMTGPEVDGIFGPATEKAVKTFQQNSGAKVDGIVGPETRGMIEKYAGNNDEPAASSPPQSTTPSSTKPWRAVNPQPPGYGRQVNKILITDGSRYYYVGAEPENGKYTGGGPVKIGADGKPTGIENLKGFQTDADNVDMSGVKESIMTDKKQLDEASININGADASEVAEILRMMQLAGAPGAKVVEPDDINPGPKPCPICGKIHGPSQPMGGCGAKPKEPGMGDMIKLMAPEEAVAEGEDKINNPAYLDIIKNLLMRAKSTEEFKDYLNNEMDEDPKFGQWMNYYAKHTPLGKRAINVYFGRDVIGEEEDYDGDFQDATTEPDETYMNDVSASIPAGNDMHKEKGSYPATAGGDNPMNTKESIKARLLQALSEKKAKPDYIDIDGDGDKKEPMKKAIKDKEKKKD